MPALLGIVATLTLANRWAGQNLRRWLLIAVSAAAGALLLRGVLGLSLLVADLLRGGLKEQIPPILQAPRAACLLEARWHARPGLLANAP